MSDDETLARLRNARAFLFDLDGTLVLGDRLNQGLRALPGAAELLALLAARGIPFAALTNGTAKTPAEQARALAAAGLAIDESQLLTPATVAADFFVRRKLQRILVLGVEGVWRPLADAGLTVIRPDEAGTGAANAQAVFVGWYRTIRMDEIELACRAVWNGAGLYAASLVPFFATAGGRALGSSRAIAAAITSITGKRAQALGKPAPAALASALRRLGCKPKDLVVVGDDPSLEVAMARRAGALGVLVASGVHEQRDLAALPERQRPHLALGGVDELSALLARG